MADFIAKQAARFDCTKGIHVESRFIPDSMVSLLRRNEPFDVWWISDASGGDDYRLSAKVRYVDFRLSRGTHFESWALSPDPTASFKVEGGILDVPTISIDDQAFTGRYSPVSPELREKILRNLEALFGVSISGARHAAPPRETVTLSAAELAAAKSEVAELLRRPLSSGHFKVRQEFSGRLSGIGVAILESLQRKGRPFELAFAMAESADPLRRSVVLQASRGKDPRAFRPLTLESIQTRGFSDPAAPAASTDKTQKAEEIHQEIVRRIFNEISALGLYRLFDSEFMDVGIFHPDNLQVPRHVVEVKSITDDNLESQVEKGIVQLARSQFYFGVESVSYHLVLQRAEVEIPDWLIAISSKFAINVHMLDLGVNGRDCCPSLFRAL